MKLTNNLSVQKESSFSYEIIKFDSPLDSYFKTDTETPTQKSRAVRQFSGKFKGAKLAYNQNSLVLIFQVR